MASGRRSGIVYSKPQEPPFLRAIKEKLGYKPPPTIDSKRQAATSDDADSRPDGPEDQPTVVVLQEGDLTMEEYKEKVKQLAENEEIMSISIKQNCTLVIMHFRKKDRKRRYYISKAFVKRKQIFMFK
ncbi:conserved hypothetical protein [Trichinella spiralis]|uniref:hypothetical protein n=1 Tax=Trichinella spiralis TaxID=6334 RepID=UPI0001EFD4E0|nr:conserved hypothetical protein [Trichinella spiralis]